MVLGGHAVGVAGAQGRGAEGDVAGFGEHGFQGGTILGFGKLNSTMAGTQECSVQRNTFVFRRENRMEQ